VRPDTLRPRRMLSPRLTIAACNRAKLQARIAQFGSRIGPVAAPVLGSYAG